MSSRLISTPKEGGGLIPYNLLIFEKGETPTVKSMSDLIKDYEIRVQRYGTSVAGSLRKGFARAIENDHQMTRFVVDPQDRRPVEYWDDEKLIKFLTGDTGRPDSSSGRKKKRAKAKPVREEKPLVKLLPLIEAFRAKRYTSLQELFVWECHVEYDDAYALSGLIGRGCYPLQRLELIDCFLCPSSAGVLAEAIPGCRTLRELCLDFNEQLFLDGNRLEAEGVIALLSKLSEAAEAEGIDRVEEARLKLLAEEEARKPAYGPLDIDPAQALEQMNQKDDDAASNTEKKSEVSSSAAKKKRKGKKGSKYDPPPSGPQVSVLKLADVGVNNTGRGGNFAPIRCAQLLRSIIANSKDLQEIDFFANEIGDLGARQLLEGLLTRKEAKLPQIGLRVGHRINQDTFDMINKLAPGPKKKGKGKKK